MTNSSDDDGDMGSLYREWKEAKQEKRALNRKYSRNLLVERGIRVDSHADGVHLVIYHPDNTRVWDFWPGTGLWKLRGTQKSGRGVFNLLRNYNSGSNQRG